MHITLIHGPNLNLLGSREPEIYGTLSHHELVQQVTKYANQLGFGLTVKQSNHEGDLVDYLQQAPHTSVAVMINPAAYTHTSIALLDAVKAIAIPVVEVHLSNIEAREPYRKVSYIKDGVAARFFGKGIDSYKEALDYLKESLS
jgi:3-dehydroquinate dehydratase-2